MPEEIAAQVGEIFSAMGFAIIKTILIYFAIPIMIVALIGRFIFKLQRKILGIIITAATFICVLVFSQKGMPYMLEIYETYINK